MPVASFEPLVINGCEPLTVPFLNTSVGDINTYEWNYFDGAGDAIAEPSHTFEKAGTYTVMLVVTSNEGCRADTILPNIITVWPQPVAGFIPNPSVTTIWEPVISFDNTTIKADSYKWDFGDSTSTSCMSPRTGTRRWAPIWSPCIRSTSTVALTPPLVQSASNKASTSMYPTPSPQR